MAELDRKKPITEVWGQVGVRYMQGDHYFSIDGREVTEDGKPIKEAEPIKVTDNRVVLPPGTPVPAEPRFEHRGGGYYRVFDHEDNLLGEDFRKEEAIAKVDELKVQLDQINQALADV